MDAITSNLVNLGVSGCMLAFFIWYLNKKDNEHREERGEWMQQSGTQANKFSEVIEKNTTALVTMQQRVDKAECKFQRHS